MGYKALLAPVYYGDRPDVSFVATAAYACSKMVGCQANMEYLLHALSLLQKAPEWEYEREWRVIDILKLSAIEMTKGCDASGETNQCQARAGAAWRA